MLTTKDMGVSGANNAGRFPGIGAIVAREAGPRRARHARATSACRTAASIGLTPGYFGGHLLGASLQPVPDRRRSAIAPTFRVHNLNLAGA